MSNDWSNAGARADVYVSGEDFGPRELPPPGLTNAVCCGVEDVGNEWSEVYGKLSHKIVILWELDERMKDGRPFMLSSSYTASLSEKANLRRDLETWRGRKFTPDELVKFNLSKLIGAGCTLNVMVGPNKQGKERASIKGVMPKQKLAPALAIVNKEMPKWIAERRAKNAAEEAARENAPADADSETIHEGFPGENEVPF